MFCSMICFIKNNMFYKNIYLVEKYINIFNAIIALYT